MKKSIFLLALLTLSAIFISCDLGIKVEKPEVSISKITAYNNKGDIIPFENGDTNVDPCISYLDIKFSKPMKVQNYYFVNYDYSDYYNGDNSRWMNEFTFRLTLKLAYSVHYKIILNDLTYKPDDQPDFDPRPNFFRDTEGNNLKPYVLTFSTKDSPADRPIEFSYDFSEILNNNNHFLELTYNKYGPNMQGKTHIESLMLPETLKKGDSLKIKYKIRSDYNLPNIIMNLVDISPIADFWRILAKEQDIPLTKESVMASTNDNPIYYENEVIFHIVQDMTTTCTLQFTYGEEGWESWDNPIQFFICGK